MTPTLSLLSPAKLNLFLHITGQRADGYHVLQSVFQLLDYGDTLQFTPDNSGQISLLGDNLALAPQDNLIMRAARLLQSSRQNSRSGIQITLHKRIPMGGGLGGGSSNAATTLLVLNHLWQCGYSNGELQAMGLSLGADVPVFVAGHSAWAEGVGEQLTPLDIPPRWYVIIHPGCHISTGEIFSDRQLTRNSHAITIAAFFQGESRNDCEAVVVNHYPEVAKALKWLGKFGNSRLTGTGACIFGSFANEEKASAVVKQIPEPWTGFMARGLRQSPVLQILA
ncbi:MAG: 4-(cytidine 5'-diphospho)-2-C-methyl-D-erythritol kinase [Parahaliea sp.]